MSANCQVYVTPFLIKMGGKQQLHDFELGEEYTGAESLGQTIDYVVSKLTRAGYDIVKENIILNVQFLPNSVL